MTRCLQKWIPQKLVLDVLAVLACRGFRYFLRLFLIPIHYQPDRQAQQWVAGVLSLPKSSHIITPTDSSRAAKQSPQNWWHRSSHNRDGIMLHLIYIYLLAGLHPDHLGLCRVGMQPFSIHWFAICQFSIVILPFEQVRYTPFCFMLVHHMRRFVIRG